MKKEKVWRKRQRKELDDIEWNPDFLYKELDGFREEDEYE